MRPLGTRAGLAPALFLALLAVACGGERPQPGAADWLTADVKPLDLEIRLDASRARVREIGPRGGTISATGADGSRFELRIPEGALVAPERITMTPVQSVGGFPLAEAPIATVQLEPSGLQLLQAATLTIRPSRDVPPMERVTFAYAGRGRDAHLYPRSMDDRRVALPIFHFSGYGFGRAAPDDPGRQLLRSAKSVRGRIHAELEAVDQQVRTGKLTELDRLAAISRALSAYYDQVLVTLLAEAERDDRMAECAIQKTVAWRHEVEQFSDTRQAPPEDPLRVRSEAADVKMANVWGIAVQKGIERLGKECRDRHDFTAIGRLIAIEREVQLLGSSNQHEAENAVHDCLRFEVEFRSVFTTKTPTGGRHEHVASRVTIDMPFLGNALEDNNAPLEYVSFQVSGDPTTDVMGEAGDALGLLDAARATLSPAGTRPGRFEVFNVSPLITNRKDTVDAVSCEGEDTREEREVIDTMTIMFSPGTPTELVRNTPRNREGTRVTNTVRDFADAMGDARTAGEMERAGRSEAWVSEEQDWATQWAEAHWGNALDLGGDGPQPGAMYAFKLAPVRTAGTWRADTAWTLPPVSGFSRSENSYIIVRHVPRTR